MIEDVSTISFFVSPLSILLETPYKIDNNFTLRIAEPNNDELGKFLHYLKTLNAFHGPSNGYGFEVYERFEKGENVLAVARTEIYKNTEEFPHFIAPESGIQWKDKPLDYIKVLDTAWKNWVIVSDPDTKWDDINNLRNAFMISNNGSVLGLTCDNYGSFDIHISNNEIYKEYPLKLVYNNNELKFRDYQQEASLSEENIKEIIESYYLLKNFDNKQYIFIKKAIEEYDNLLLIPRSSSLLLVGLFSVLELLLSHDDRNPNASRISWQLQKKIILLNNQFKDKVNFAKHFNCSEDTKEETIIERLYQKRSLIAHGNQGDFSKDLQIISKGDEISFLRLLLRKTISYALRNPLLINDLREC